MIDSSCRIFMVSPSFHGWSFLLWSCHKRFFCKRQHRIQIFRHFSFCVASIKLLQSLRLFEILLLYRFSAGVTEVYPILIRCETKPYLYTLSNYTLSLYIFELYPILIHYRTLPYLNTLLNSTLSSYITELYPILIHSRSIFSHCHKSKQYPRA